MSLMQKNIHAEWFDKNNTITSAYMFSKNFLDRIGSEELS